MRLLCGLLGAAVFVALLVVALTLPSSSTGVVEFGIVDQAVKHFRAKYDVIDVDGVRVLFGDGWGLIRASNTQPVLVTRYEALSRNRLDVIQREMEDWLRSQGVSP